MRRSHAVVLGVLLLALLTLAVERYIINRSASASVSNQLPRAEGLIDAVAFSPDGKLFITGGAYALDQGSVPPTKTAVLRAWRWLSPTIGPTFFKGHTDDIKAVAFSPDGRKIASASFDQTVRIWDVNNPQAPPVVLTGTSFFFSVAFSPDGKMLAAGSLEGPIRIWNLPQLNAPALIPNGSAQADALSFSGDSQLLAFNGVSGVRVVMLNQNHSEINLPERSLNVAALAFSHSGHLLAAGDYSGNIYIWDLQKPDVAPRHLRIGTASSDANEQLLAKVTRSIVFSPDDKKMASASDNGTLRIWDMATTADPMIVTKELGRIQALAWSPDGKTLAEATGLDVKFWSVGMSASTTTNK